MYATVKAIEYYLPENQLTNEELEKEFPEWTIAKIESKTGISKRHFCTEDECSSDLAYRAAQKLFKKNDISPEKIDYLILCTQSPDYFLPTTACILQDWLGIPTSAGAMDFNLGCSGFVYGLGLAKGLIESEQAKNVLLITAETYTKFIHHADKSVRSIFGDAAAATLVIGEYNEKPSIGPFVYGTDGSGHQKLIVPVGGMRRPKENQIYIETKDGNGNIRTEENLFMDGPAIFSFTIKIVPRTVNQLLRKSNLSIDKIDFFIFHQANKFMLDYLRKKIKVPEDKFIISMSDVGNTVSSTIPIAFKNKIDDGTIKPGSKILLFGFGVGYSWGATLLEWNG
jgi:3-oxoacyl-[acyl-carrier-protein] synthase III